MAAQQRIVVRATNWLGDVVMSLPALRAIRAARPDAHLAVLVRTDLASFFAGATWLDEIVPFRPTSGLGKASELLYVARTLRARRYDLAIVFPRSFESALWMRLAGIPERIGYGGDARASLLTQVLEPSPEVEALHQVNRYLHLVRRTLGIEGSPDDYAPDVDDEARGRMGEWLAARRRALGPLLALAPGAAYGPAKEWPATSYAALTERVAAEHATECVLVGAPSERAKCEEVARISRAATLVAAGETSFGELVALLSLADGFAGNDSGAMHVAGALGRPTVGIFGSTSPEKTGPLGSRTCVLYEAIECSPCYARTCRFGHYDCLRRIDAVTVSRSLAELGAFDKG